VLQGCVVDARRGIVVCDLPDAVEVDEVGVEGAQRS
jgi:hypothetical protein